MLINGINLYTQAGDTYSAEICQKELRKTVKRVKTLDMRLSDLGWMIDDQPVTELPKEIMQYAE